MKKYIFVLLILSSFGQGFAQIKLPSKEPENKPPVKQTTTVKTTETKSASTVPMLTLKITTDTDCNFYVDGEYKGFVGKDDILKVNLKQGEYQLKSVEVDNPNNVFKEYYTVNQIGIEKFYNVKLQGTIEKKVEEEKKVIQQQTTHEVEAKNEQIFKGVKVNYNSGAVFTWETTTLDFGRLMQGDETKATKVFRFMNSGGQPLIISECKGSCGCTVPTCPTEVIKPGETGSIKVHYDVNRVGPFTKTVTVNSNAVSVSDKLTIKGEVVVP